MSLVRMVPRYKKTKEKQARRHGGKTTLRKRIKVSRDNVPPFAPLQKYYYFKERTPKTSEGPHKRKKEGDCHKSAGIEGRNFFLTRKKKNTRIIGIWNELSL